MVSDTWHEPPGTNGHCFTIGTQMAGWRVRAMGELTGARGHLCMCAHPLHTCPHICSYSCTHAHVGTHSCPVCTYTHIIHIPCSYTYTLTWEYAHSHTQSPTHTHMLPCTWVHTHVPCHIHAHVYKHPHTHVHTHHIGTHVFAHFCTHTRRVHSCCTDLRSRGIELFFPQQMFPQ